jgi:hypothetical protein
MDEYVKAVFGFDNSCSDVAFKAVAFEPSEKREA